MADQDMNTQGGSPEMSSQGKSGSGKAWGWVVLIIIILLVIWGLFALGDEDVNDDVLPEDDNMENIEEDLEDTTMEEDGTMEEVGAELNVEGEADAMEE